MRFALPTATLLLLGCLEPKPDIPEDYPALTADERAHAIFEVEGQGKRDEIERGLGLAFDEDAGAYRLFAGDLGLWVPAAEVGRYTSDDYAPGQVELWWEGANQTTNCEELGAAYAEVEVIGSVAFEEDTIAYGRFSGMVCGIVDPTPFTIEGTFSAIVEDL